MKYKTMLFIPGNNPGMLQSMDILGADAYLVDLEDAVSLDNKDAARDLVSNFIKEIASDKEIFIRINPPDTPYFKEDVDELKNLPIKGFMLPKASKETVEILHNEIKDTDLEIFALIETSKSLENAYDTLSASDKLVGVLLGAEDLTLDLGAQRTKDSNEILYARMKIVAAAKSNRLQAIDTPWTDTDDLEGLEKDTLKAKGLGMTGRALISPRHVDIVNKIYMPSEKDVQYALRVFEALKQAKIDGKGAFSLDGKMVDRPIILRARDVLLAVSQLKEEYVELLK